MKKIFFIPFIFSLVFIFSSAYAQSVSISITSGAQTICAGTIVSFAAKPIDGGTSPVYQWFKNNIAVGTNSPSYADAGLKNNDVIVCKMTSSLNGIVAISAGIKMSVATALPIVNSIPDQIVCAGVKTIPINFFGTGNSYNWTNSNTNIGLSAKSSGNINAFTAINETNAPVTSVVKVTPSIGSPEIAYVPSFVSENVAVVNTSTGSLITSIKAGGNPVGVVVSPDGSKVFITNSEAGSNDTGTVYAISTVTNTVIATIKVGYEPRGIAISADGNFLYIANSRSGTVSVVNTITNKVTAEISVGNLPECIAVHPDGKTIYVTNRYDATVSILSTVTNTVISTISVGSEPKGIAFSSDGNLFYVVCSGRDTVFIYNTATNNEVSSIRIDNEPTAIVLTPDGKRAYVTNYISQNVAVIDLTSSTFVKRIPVGVGPSGISISSNGEHVYVANRGFNYAKDSMVTVINTIADTVETSFKVGVFPYALGNFIKKSTEGCSGASQSFKITVLPHIEPKVSISISQGNPTTFYGTKTIFTAVPTNGGASPTFQWQKNGFNFGSNSSIYIDSTLEDGDSITCILNSNIQCPFPNPVKSNSIVMTVAKPVVSISITSGNQSTCFGNSVTFSAVLNSTESFVYQWKKNGNNVGPNQNTYTDAGLKDNDIISCAVTNTTIGLTTLSNTIPIHVYIGATQTIDDIATQNVCDGYPAVIKFTGHANSFNWTNDNPNIGLDTAGNGQQISFTPINSTSSTITATITAIPTTFSPELAYLTDGFSDPSVYAVNTATNSVIATYHISGAFGVATTPDGTRAYITASYNLIYGIDTKTNLVADTILVGGDTPISICVSPDGNKIYVVNKNSNNVSVIKTDTKSVLTTISVGQSPYGIAINPAGDRLYITNLGDNTVSVINTGNNQVVATVPTDFYPTGICVSPDGNRIYVTNNAYDGTVDVIDAASNKVMNKIPVGINPVALTTSLDGSRLYVTTGSRTVAVINTNNYSTVANIDIVDASPYGLSLGTDGNFLYVAGQFAHKMYVIDTRTNKIVITKPVNLTPVSFGNFIKKGVTANCTGTPKTFKINVNPNVSAQVSIAITGGSINNLRGTKVTFTATPTIGGTAPIFKWQKNNNEVGTNSSIYSDSTLEYGDVISCILQSSDCTGNTNVFSNTIIMKTVYPVIRIAITIGSAIICNGTSTNVTFTASPMNAGDAPVFQWKKNGNNVGTNSITYTEAALKDKDVIFCKMTSPLTGIQIESNRIKIGVSNSTFNAVVNAVSNYEYAAGTQTTPINFTGTGTSYSWTNNNTNIGLPSSGFGDIDIFTTTNPSRARAVATITVTPLNNEPDIAYVPNFDSNNISVINSKTNSVITTIPVGGNPEGVAVSPDGNFVYVTNSAFFTSDRGGVTVINTNNNSVITTIPVGRNPVGICISPDGSRVYVTNNSSFSPDAGTVSIINTTTNIVIAEITVGISPSGITISPDGSKVYVTNENSNSVSVISTTTNSVVATIRVGAYPNGICISPDGNLVYVANYLSDNVAVINTLSNRVIAYIQTEKYPWGMASNPDGRSVYVTNSGSNSISVIDVGSNKIIKNIQVGNTPYGVGVNSTGDRVFVTNFKDNSVSIINTNTNQVMETVSVGISPFAYGNFFKSGNNGCSGSPKTFTITVGSGFHFIGNRFAYTRTPDKANSPAVKFSANSSTGIKIYPNPASDILFVENTEDNLVEIINALGQVVRTEMSGSKNLLEFKI